MRVYVLHLDGVGALTRAFDRVMDCEAVASCAIEPEALRLRFLAPARSAEALVHGIYLEGGLVWCSGHDVLAGRG
jgi:hypothetical protein